MVFLSSADIDAIDYSARDLLWRVGVRIDDPATLDALERDGAAVDRETGRSRLTRSWLDDRLGKAPERFVLHGRDRTHDLQLGQGRVHFGNGGRVFRVRDIDSGEFRPTGMRDLAAIASLVEHLEQIDFFIIPCQAEDLAAEQYHANEFWLACNHTAKHVMGGCGDLRGVEQIWRLGGLLAGSAEAFAAAPFLSVITNTVSPLIFNADVLRIMRFCCQNGLPLTCAPAPIAGATAPATLAGALTQQHAESLAAVAIAQVFQPGARILYGAVLSSMDLRHMDFCLGAAEMAIMNAAAVQLAKHSRLPIYASAGVTDAKTPDVQAGMEKALSQLLVAQAGGDAIHLAAGMLDSGNSVAYEQYLIDDELIGMVRRCLAGVRVDEQTLAQEVIARVGPGGNYVTEDHTVDHMFDEFFFPRLAVRSNFDVWNTGGRQGMGDRARQVASELLEQHAATLLAAERRAAVEAAFPGIVTL